MKKYLGLIIGLILTLIHVLQVFISNLNATDNTEYVINDSVFYTLLGMIIAVILILLKRKEWVVAFFLIGLAALSPYFSFSSESYFIGLGNLKIKLISLFIFIIHFNFNPSIKQSILKLFEKSDEQKGREEKSKSDIFENKVKRFENKYSAKSHQELEKIVEESVLIPEAIEAAKRLLDKN